MTNDQSRITNTLRSTTNTLNPNTPDFHEIVLANAEENLFAQRSAVKDPGELNAVYRAFLKHESERIRDAHREGACGLEIAAWRSALLDVIINDHYSETNRRLGGPPPYSLAASGGYGRALLNPGSDVDLQFLFHRELSGKENKAAKRRIGDLLTLLYDAALDVGHGARTETQAIEFANEDHPTKTALLDARYIAGDPEVFDAFEERFFRECIEGKERDYLKERSQMIRKRHRKYGRTVHRQEPHVKMGCGGLRDYHNLIWLIWMLQKSRDLKSLVKDNQLSLIAYTEIESAYEFLMRVRNELHYLQKNNSGDILTLRLQGIIARRFDYPGKTIIQRSENFMRDYYKHTRSLYQHGTSLMQSFHLEVEESSSFPVPIIGALAARFHARKDVKFDGYVVRDGLIFPEPGNDPFAEDPKEMMRFFLRTQQRGLKTSPEIRRLFKDHWHKIDAEFRYSRANREVFEQILLHRGQVAHILRQMHRVDFLGRYLPEFGHLTDLVQHEFFHQYTADEHTLRCIDQLDRLLRSEDPQEKFLKRIFQDMEDSVALYLALIMHDTGRAEGVRVHEDASAQLASNVCRRLHFSGDRLRLVMFLVDHHLTFWRTATTKDISSRETISDFASAVRNRQWLEALYLFTYVDSKGTNEEAWNDWKASLMKQLYASTCAYFEDRKAFDKKFSRPAFKTQRRVLEKLSDSYEEEVEAHFKTLPERYFTYRGSTSIARHVRLFRKFFEKFLQPGPASLEPVIGWESRQDEGYTLMEVVCWNRHGLLAKVAGALASRKLNILSADLFIREDDLVLDIFRVCTTNFGPIRSENEINRIEKLIARAFAEGEDAREVDFKNLIDKQAAPSVLDQPKPDFFRMPQRVFVSNEQSDTSTVLEIQAEDRIGLLYDIFTVLSELDAEVLNARISTQAGAAIDRFYLIDTHTEKKIVDPVKLKAIQKGVWKCVAAEQEEFEAAQDSLTT